MTHAAYSITSRFTSYLLSAARTVTASLYTTVSGWFGRKREVTEPYTKHKHSFIESIDNESEEATMGGSGVAGSTGATLSADSSQSFDRLTPLAQSFHRPATTSSNCDEEPVVIRNSPESIAALEAEATKRASPRWHEAMDKIRADEGSMIPTITSNSNNYRVI